MPAPLPRHLPFWLKPLSLFGLLLITTAQQRFIGSEGDVTATPPPQNRASDFHRTRLKPR